MFEQLKNLVFGLNEYDKTKYEVRFELIGEFIENLNIKKIEDFEIIEDVIYKIKDQLRVKSSNLNKVINDSAKPLKRRDVELILDTLSKIKYNFLKKVFNIEELSEDSESLLNNSSKKLSTINKKNFDKIEKEKQEISTDIQFIEKKGKISESFEKPKKESIIKELKELDLTIQENNKYKVILENGIVPHILINFKEEIDYKIIKQYLITFFDTYYPEGTNIIVEDSRALIIPRFNGDNLFNLPQKESNDIDEIYEKLKSKSNIKETVEPKENYINVEKIKNHQKPTSKKLDKGLDDLLTAEVKKKDYISHGGENEKVEDIKIIKSDPIVVEKDIKIKQADNEKDSIEIIKIDDKPEEKEEVRKEIDLEKLEKKEEINKNNSNISHLIYEDDKIVSYLESNSKILGEIIIEHKNNKKLSELNEADLSYISIFSKIFSSALFEIIEAHGTNLFWDYNSNKLRIIPRFQEDKINIDWKPQNMNYSTLEDIQNKLVKRLSQDLEPKEKEKVEAEVVHSPKIEQKEQKKDKNSANSKSLLKTQEGSFDNSLEEKAKYILESLRRIP